MTKTMISVSATSRSRTFAFVLIIGVMLGISILPGPVNSAVLDRTDGSNSNSIDSKSANLKEDCSAVPKIEIVGYRRDGFVPSVPGETELMNMTDSYIQAPDVALVDLECRSERPIQWTFDGVDNPPARVIYITRRPEENSGLLCYTSRIRIKTLKRSTGRYRCETLDRVHNAVMYIYADANVPPFLLNDNRRLKIFADEDSTVILPCQVVNHFMKPQLYLIEGSSQVAVENIQYDSDVGFTLDLKNFTNPFGEYECRVLNDRVTIFIKRKPTYEVIPSSRKVLVQRNNRTQLTCKSKEPIHLQGDFDKNLLTMTEIKSSVYKHKISYDFMGLENINISCVESGSKKTIHNWNVNVIDPDVSSVSGIFYNASSNRFFCRSKTDIPPTIVLAYCNNPSNCKFLDKCLKWDAPYLLDGNRDANCAGIERETNCNQTDTTSTGCSYVDNVFESGVVFCLPENEETHTVQFFKGVGEGKPVITQWKDAPQNQLVHISGPNRTLYVGENVTFSCTAVKLIFAHGFTWMFEMRDGSLVPIEKLTESEDPVDLKASTITESITVKIDNVDISGIVCAVPTWNTSEWFNMSREITTEIGSSPTILDPEEEASVVIRTGTSHSILCQVQGIPTPTIQWYKNGKSLPSEYIANSENNSASNWHHLGVVDEDDVGEYTCVASNLISSQNRTIHLGVHENNAKGKFLTAVGLIFFVCLGAMVLILLKRLRGKNALLKKLISEKEILKFRDGDRKALLHNAEGYIQADYLGFGPEYEIPPEELHIENAVKLGDGAFGEVLKCTLTLRRNNDKEEEVEVAVKRTQGSDYTHFKALLSELKILAYIGWVGHENVITLLGAVTRNLKYHDIYVVMEYCHLGSLKSFLEENKSFYLHQVQNDVIDLNITFNASQVSSNGYLAKNYTMSTGDLVNWSEEIASGMEYLSKKGVIHGDLAARNVLLTSDRTAKICDFGLSIHLYNDEISSTPSGKQKLPWRYLAPEIMLYNKFSFQSDVWAYGVTLWEIFTLGETPYPGMTFSPDFWDKIIKGYRMDKPEYANLDIYKQMLHCWDISPNDRHTFTGLREFFHRISTSLICPNNQLPLIIPTPETVEYLDPNMLDHLCEE